MTVKAGQKCTAIRRAMAPAEHLDAVEAAIRERLAGDQGRRPARQGDAHGRAGQPRPARRRPRPDRQARRRGRADRRRAIPTPRPASRAAPSCTRSCCAPTTPGRRRGPRRRGVRPGLDRHALPRPRRRDRARQPRHGQPRACRCSPIRPTPRAISSAARPPFTGGCWSSTAPMPRNRPATARRCRSSSTAVPAAPAAARRWAACAASSITCSAPRSSRRRR